MFRWLKKLLFAQRKTILLTSKEHGCSVSADCWYIGKVLVCSDHTIRYGEIVKRDTYWNVLFLDYGGVVRGRPELTCEQGDGFNLLYESC